MWHNDCEIYTLFKLFKVWAVNMYLYFVDLLATTKPLKLIILENSLPYGMSKINESQKFSPSIVLSFTVYVRILIG